MPRFQSHDKYLDLVKPKLDFIYNCLSRGIGISSICSKLQITRVQWRKYYEKYYEFRQCVDAGNQAQVEQVETALFSRALGSTHTEIEYQETSNGEQVISRKTVKKKNVLPDVSAAKFILTNRSPEKWRELQRVEMQGEVGMDIVLPLPDVPPSIAETQLIESDEELE